MCVYELTWGMNSFTKQLTRTFVKLVQLQSARSLSHSQITFCASNWGSKQRKTLASVKPWALQNYEAEGTMADVNIEEVLAPLRARVKEQVSCRFSLISKFI